MRDLFWHYFIQTGNLDAYLLFKENGESHHTIEPHNGDEAVVVEDAVEETE